MPIPGDNGNPKKEKEAQEKRIEEVSKKGADMTCDIPFRKPPEKTNFGNIK